MSTPDLDGNSDSCRNSQDLSPGHSAVTRAVPGGVRCAAILLAAGRGRRFDPTGHQDKLLQAGAGTLKCVAARACASLAGATDAVLAVVRPEASIALTEALQAEGASVTVCEQADLGMGHSLAHAVREARLRWPTLEALLVMPADMPWVKISSALAVVQTLNSQPRSGIVVPVTPEGVRGHPVGFDRRHFDALESLQGDAGARHLLQSEAVQRVVLDDPGIMRDVDTPQDLTQAPES